MACRTLSLKALNPKDCGTIGNQAVCDMDVLQVADVSGWAEQGIRFCFKGYGQVLFVPSHDADRQPIDQKTAQPETLPVEVDGEHVCVTINRDGKLFLIDAARRISDAHAGGCASAIFAYWIGSRAGDGLRSAAATAGGRPGVPRRVRPQ